MIEKHTHSYERVILVGLATKTQPYAKTVEFISELEELCSTLEINSVKKVIQKLEKQDRSTYIGSGKVVEIAKLCRDLDVDTVVFDDELTPTQVRNLEKELQCKILDRSLLILDIFAMRAKTSQAKIQVELAQYQYLLPRLTKMWAHLTKQRGGSPGMRGPGEKELETDKRIVKDKINILRKKLHDIEKQEELQSKQRSKLVRVALVGYTNAGKSTLMKLLTGTDVLVEDKLFATISSTVRKIVINDIPFLLTDTVGFIRKLPHKLIECFKSTLSEVNQADILLHVVDFSNKEYEDHIKTVNSTLSEINAQNKKTILILNKIDRVRTFNNADKEKYRLEIKKARLKYNASAIFISAKKKVNINELKELIYNKILGRHMEIFPNYLEKNKNKK